MGLKIREGFNLQPKAVNREQNLDLKQNLEKFPNANLCLRKKPFWVPRVETLGREKMFKVLN